METKINLHEKHRQRLKARALREGLDGFEPHNVLELMLFFVLPHVDTNEIAHELINKFGSLNGVFNAPFEELVQVKGIKNHAATFLKLIPEFSRCYAVEASAPRHDILTTDEIKERFLPLFIGRKEEIVACMFFDIKGKLIDTKVLFKGSINSVSFSYRDLVNEALTLNAFKVAVAHNHLNGSPIPSPDDLHTYKVLSDSLAKVSIEFIDSYVIAGDKCISAYEFAINGARCQTSH